MLRKLFGRLGPGTPADPIESTFGVLERDVLRVLWEQGDLAVRDVQSRLSREVAYTTVMTTLDRLFKKGVLSRRQAGRAFFYSAAVTPQQLRAEIAGHVLAGVLRSRDMDAAPVLSNLLDSVGEQDPDLLRKLEHMIRERRRELTRKR